MCRARFGAGVAVLHSALPEVERATTLSTLIPADQPQKTEDPGGLDNTTVYTYNSGGQILSEAHSDINDAAATTTNTPR